MLNQIAFCQKILPNLKKSIDTNSRPLSSETAYLQFDKPYYAAGDTMWFKAYLLNPSYLTPSGKSGLMYIDIANDSDKVVKQYRFPVWAGLTWGNISLNENDYKPGSYTLRAYTNWMRNWGEKDFFFKRFYITGLEKNRLFVSTIFKISQTNKPDTIDAKLKFSYTDKSPFALKTIDMQVFNGNNSFYKQKLHTDLEGKTQLNFNAPQKPYKLAIVARSELVPEVTIIPVALNNPDNIDIQFMPEGGELVAGIPAHIGFKAIGEDGKGSHVSGIVIDKSKKEVAKFESEHNGMGSFKTYITSGENYVAKVFMPNGLVREYPLPDVKPSGSVLQIKNRMESDSVDVFVGVTGDVAETNTNFYLIGKSRGIICYAAIIGFNKNIIGVRKKIAKSLFPTGIAHFSLLAFDEKPLNERLTFIDHRDYLKINITTDRPYYKSRDSVALHLKVTDAVGNPVKGSFSIAVTDDSQIREDTLYYENLVTRMLLTSDLNGFVENPIYYFEKNSAAWTAMDNLLLTQGWVSYDSKRELTKMGYDAEKEFLIKGKVTNVFNKPIKSTKVTLFSKSPLILMDTLTDNDGNFVFNNFPKIENPIFIIQAVNRNGKSFNVNVNINEINPPTFNMPSLPTMIPWYINTDTTLLNYTKTSNEEKQLQYLLPNGHMLDEVKIISKKVVKSSQNVNGSGNADIVLNEKELEKIGKKTFLDILIGKIKGFREGTFYLQGYGEKTQKDFALLDFVTDIKSQFKPINQDWYFINDKPVKFIIDGVPLYKFYTLDPNEPVINDLTRYLKSHNAEDIKGIEVLISTKFVLNYIPSEWASAIFPSDVAFVEITTRSGNGPGIVNIPGMYMYKPLLISYPTFFYKPKYSLRESLKKAFDLRATIDWESNVITDTKGEATISFYTADNSNPNSYSVMVEGVDLNGGIGFNKKKLVLKK